MPETPQPIVILIGEFQSPQFRSALLNDQAGGVLSSVEIRSVNLLPDAIALVGTGELLPDLVVLYQSIPDEYSTSDVDRLIGMLPLSRFVIAFSPWCESIGRTEQRWPSAWSVPLVHASARIRFELRQLMADNPPLPATTSRDEAFSTLATGCLQETASVGHGLSARVISSDVPLKECYEQILENFGFGLDNDKLPDLYIVAAAFIDESQIHLVKKLHDDEVCSQGLPTKGSTDEILVASDMATPGDRTRLLEAGATAVISQLRFAEELIDHLSTIQLET